MLALIPPGFCSYSLLERRTSDRTVRASHSYDDQITEEIKALMMEARTAAALETNKQLLKTYWNIGRIIVEHEQDGNLYCIFRFSRRVWKNDKEQLIHEVKALLHREEIESE